MKSSKKEEIVLTVRDVMMMHEAVSRVKESFQEVSNDTPIFVSIDGPLVSLSFGLSVGECDD